MYVLFHLDFKEEKKQRTTVIKLARSLGESLAVSILVVRSIEPRSLLTEISVKNQSFSVQFDYFQLTDHFIPLNLRSVLTGQN